MSFLNRSAFLILFLLSTVALIAQSPKPDDKIDPVFKALIAEQNKSTPTKKKCFLKRKKKTDKISATNALQKKYDCIVYTKNAKALRDKGIIIHSELKTFVTAFATLNQIVGMSKMAEVTYIAAPSIDQSHLP